MISFMRHLNYSNLTCMTWLLCTISKSAKSAPHIKMPPQNAPKQNFMPFFGSSTTQPSDPFPKKKRTEQWRMPFFMPFFMPFLCLFYAFLCLFLGQ